LLVPGTIPRRQHSGSIKSGRIERPLSNFYGDLDSPVGPDAATPTPRHPQGTGAWKAGEAARPRGGLSFNSRYGGRAAFRSSS
jgi:hypothetical protein